MRTALADEERPGKQGTGMGLMHLVVLATPCSLTAAGIPVLLVDVWTCMVNVMGKSTEEVGEYHPARAMGLRSLSYSLSPCVLPSLLQQW